MHMQSSKNCDNGNRLMNSSGIDIDNVIGKRKRKPSLIVREETETKDKMMQRKKNSKAEGKVLNDADAAEESKLLVNTERKGYVVNNEFYIPVCTPVSPLMKTGGISLEKKDTDITYVDMKTFEQLAHEIKEIKQFIINFSSSQTDNILIKYKKLETDVNNLSQEIAQKDELIQSLIKKMSVITSNNIGDHSNGTSTIKPIADAWHTKGNAQNHYDSKDSTPAFEIPVHNRFNGFPLDEDVFIEDDQPEEHSKHFNDSMPKENADIKKVINKSKVYTDPYPERNKLPLKNVLENITRIHSSSEFTKRKNKTVIISDSTTRRIDMREFNHFVKNCEVVKRTFPGATASQLKYYVQAALNEDKPNTIIISAGTNNLTKKNQTVQDTAKEIVDIVKTCCEGGVKKIFVSSLICRPAYYYEINEINKLLKYHTSTYDYTFIENSNIREEHLWKDNVHLNNEGISILAIIICFI